MCLCIYYHQIHGGSDGLRDLPKFALLEGQGATIKPCSLGLQILCVFFCFVFLYNATWPSR